MRVFKIVLSILLLTLFTACGGGGGGGKPGNLPTGSSNWDQMIWDQEKWG